MLKKFPVVITLIAVLVAGVASLLKQADLYHFAVIILATVAVFFTLGQIIKVYLLKRVLNNKKNSADIVNDAHKNN